MDDLRGTSGQMEVSKMVCILSQTTRRMIISGIYNGEAKF